MTSKRATRYRRPSGRRKTYQWVPASITPVTLGAGVKSFSDLLSTVNSDVLAGSMIERVVGSWASQSFSDDLTGTCHYGLIILGGDAFDAVALPESTDAAPWLFKDTQTTLVGMTTGGVQTYVQYPIDIKPRRKLRAERSKFVSILENISASIAVLEGIFNLRILLSK